MKHILMGCLAWLLAGCLGMPESVKPVQDFDVKRYMGQWYEIARLDHSFERGLEQVTAQYTQQADGSVQVINRGYSPGKGEWKEAIGKAYFVNQASEGYLKVSFFGPFYGSYVVFGLDKDHYQYAFISGPDHSYLWLLARTPQVDPRVIEQFVESARQHGFDVDELIYVKQVLPL